MASPSTAEQEEPTTELPTTDSEPDAEEDAGSEVDEEEEMKNWLSARYKRGSTKPMKERLTAPWGLPISDADAEKLKVGFRSTSMDDKWDLLVEDPDENGGVSVHIIRNWVQEEHFIIHIVPKPSTDEDGGSAKIQGITWEGNRSGWQCGAEQAQKEAVILSRGWLRCEFEGLPHLPSSVYWDLSAYKKLDAPAAQPGNDVAGTPATDPVAARDINPSLWAHVASLGSGNGMERRDEVAERERDSN